MSTDRELLELAAQAAGYEVREHPNYRFNEDLVFLYKGVNWNPLTNDGDALKLAVMVGFDVRILKGEANYTEIEKRQTNIGRATERHGGDPCTATRRAIVRASADIGMAMK